MRADKYFASRFGSRTKAAQALDRGLILLDGKVLRAKDEVNEGARIEIREADDLFVSNGGYKLDRAIKIFNLNCQDKVFVDIGASTGGFTDCLLQNHAKKIYAVDVGESQLHEKLQSDPRVIPMDNTNMTKTKTIMPFELTASDKSPSQSNDLTYLPISLSDFAVTLSSIAFPSPFVMYSNLSPI